MKVIRLELGFFKVNCYILCLDNLNIIIDPGSDFNEIEKCLKNEEITPDFILNTHGHYDHISAVPEIIKKYNIPFYIHKLEEPIITDPVKNLSSFFNGNELLLKTYNLIEENNYTYFNDFGLNIINTPGHTPGSIVIKYCGVLFTGDLLFKGSIGRTDLTGGDSQKIKNSLKILKSMEKDLIIYPGHGESSTLKFEIHTNYYLNENFLNS